MVGVGCLEVFSNESVVTARLKLVLPTVVRCCLLAHVHRSEVALPAWATQRTIRAQTEVRANRAKSATRFKSIFAEPGLRRFGTARKYNPRSKRKPSRYEAYWNAGGGAGSFMTLPVRLHFCCIVGSCSLLQVLGREVVGHRHSGGPIRSPTGQHERRGRASVDGVPGAGGRPWQDGICPCAGGQLPHRGGQYCLP